LSIATRPETLYNGPPMKIALVGSHGVGKTTLCFEVAAALKRRNADLEMVREVARRCPLPINQETTVAAQEWILHSQIGSEIEAEASHEVVICDRSVLDNYCYLVHSGGSLSAWEHFLDHWMPTYDVLVHVPISERPSYDGVRAVDPGFQKQIELLLEGMIAARSLNPIRLDPNSRVNWCRTIVDALLPKLEPTLPLFSEDPE